LEDDILKRRREREERYKQRLKRQKQYNTQRSGQPGGFSEPVLGKRKLDTHPPRDRFEKETRNTKQLDTSPTQTNQKNMDAAAALRATIMGQINREAQQEPVSPPEKRQRSQSGPQDIRKSNELISSAEISPKHSSSPPSASPT